jgi:GNAT superfamily N-acetyltransferase
VAWRVRPALAADGARVADVRVRSWRHAYRHILPVAALAAMRPEDTAARFAGFAEADAPTKLFVAVGGGDVPVAYCIVGQARDEVDRHPDLPTGELWGIYALPEAIGTGVGHALHEAGLDHLAKYGFVHAVLWVFEANDKARRFYGAHGWAPDGGREDFHFGGRSVPEIRYARSIWCADHRRAPG